MNTKTTSKFSSPQRRHLYQKLMERRGTIGQLVLLAIVVLLIGVWLCYVLQDAALLQPQRPDGHEVEPIPNEDRAVVDDNEVVTPKRLKRHPVIGVASLEKPDDNDIKVQNWDAALTLARLSSEVYFDGRVRFAKETLGFEEAAPVDNGDRHSMVCSNSNVLVVTFRGTETWTDKLLDLGVVPIRLGPFDSGCDCHAGFYLAYSSLYDGIIQEIERQNGRNKQIIVTGHSLGGAMAIMFAYHAEIKDGLKVKNVVTFGQPLLANEAFARMLVSHFRGRHKRFVHRDDIISRVARPFFHSGARILLAEGESPLFWEAEILSKAGPEGLAQAGPSITIDPDVEALSELEMQVLIDYSRTNQMVDLDERQPRRTKRPRHRRPGQIVGAAAPPNVTATVIDWIAQGLEDHKMKYYIQCIEAIEFDVDA